MSTKRDLRTGEMGRELSLGVNRLADVDYNSLLFRAPRTSGGPDLALEFNLKRLDFFIAPAADVLGFPDIISRI